MDQEMANQKTAGGQKTEWGQEDPIYLHTLSEAKIILSLWAVALLWTCTYCYLFGYSTHQTQPSAWGPSLGQWVGPLASFDREVSTLSTPGLLGIPDWVCYGIVIPWLFCILATLWFCLFVFHDDDLGKEWGETPDLQVPPIAGEANLG